VSYTVLRSRRPHHRGTETAKRPGHPPRSPATTAVFADPEELLSGGSDDMDCPNPKRRAAQGLPEDIILEILERLSSARSIHRFKCVSRRWRDLIADPVNRKRFPQTLEGFFFSGGAGNSTFISLLHGVTTAPPLFDTSFSFLTTRQPGNKFKNITLFHSCGGLLLFGHGTDQPQGGINSGLGYIVCNPVTEQWVAVPSPGCLSWRYLRQKDLAMGRMSTYIIFDASVSPHFHLFHLWSNSFDFIMLRTYSSESGVWTDSASTQTQVVTGRGVPRRRCKVALTACTGNAFVNGVLHFVVFGRLIGLGCQGETCRVIRWPADKHSSLNPLFIGQSQGRLYCICGYKGEGFFYQSGISVWVLESYDTQEWVLKHNVSFLEMFGKKEEDRVHFYYNVVAIHPDCNWVFLVQNCSRKLIAYDMGNKKVHALGTLTHMYWYCTLCIPNFSELSVLANKR
ncbi:hypothetical protein U9M48_005228, partial [Paspalum notatum var. saurae]